jgi:hypothetical protein
MSREEKDHQSRRINDDELDDLGSMFSRFQVQHQQEFHPTHQSRIRYPRSEDEIAEVNRMEQEAVQQQRRQVTRNIQNIRRQRMEIKQKLRQEIQKKEAEKRRKKLAAKRVKPQTTTTTVVPAREHEIEERETFTSPGNVIFDPEDPLITNRFIPTDVLPYPASTEDKLAFRKFWEQRQKKLEESKTLGAMNASDPLNTHSRPGGGRFEDDDPGRSQQQPASEINTPAEIEKAESEFQRIVDPRRLDLKRDVRPLVDLNNRYVKQRECILNIRSSDRDKILYPNANRFVVSLPRTFNNVKSIRLLSTEFPNREQVFRFLPESMRNNRFPWQLEQDVRQPIWESAADTPAVGSATITTKFPHNLRVGDRIEIVRTTTEPTVSSPTTFYTFHTVTSVPTVASFGVGPIRRFTFTIAAGAGDFDGTILDGLNTHRRNVFFYGPLDSDNNFLTDRSPPNYTVRIDSGNYIIDTLKLEIETKTNRSKFRVFDNQLNQMSITMDVDKDITSIRALDTRTLGTDALFTDVTDGNIVNVNVPSHRLNWGDIVRLTGIVDFTDGATPPVTLLQEEELNFFLKRVSNQRLDAGTSYPSPGDIANNFSVTISRLLTDGTDPDGSPDNQDQAFGGTAAILEIGVPLKLLWDEFDDTAPELFGFLREDSSYAIYNFVARGYPHVSLSATSEPNTQPLTIRVEPEYLPPNNGALDDIEVGDLVRIIDMRAWPPLDIPEDFFTITEVQKSGSAVSFTLGGVYVRDVFAHPDSAIFFTMNKKNPILTFAGSIEAADITTEAVSNNVIITATAHGLDTGDQVRFRDVFTEPDVMNNTVFSVFDVTANSFKISTAILVNSIELRNREIFGFWGSNKILVTHPVSDIFRIKEGTFFQRQGNNLRTGMRIKIYRAESVGGIHHRWINTNDPSTDLNFQVIDRFLTPPAAPTLPTTRVPAEFASALPPYQYVINLKEFAQFKEQGGGRNTRITSARAGFHPIQQNVNDGQIDRPIRLEGDDYVLLTLNTAIENIDDSGGQSNVFAKIGLSDLPGSVIFDSFVSAPKTFESGLLRELRELELEVLTPDGKPYEFLNEDYSLTLEVSEILDVVKYTQVSSRTGIADETSFTAIENANLKSI